MRWWQRTWPLRALLVGQFLAAMAVAVAVLAVLMVTWRLPQVAAQTRQDQGRVADLAVMSLEQALDNVEGLIRVLAGLRDTRDDNSPAADIAADMASVAFDETAQRLLNGDTLFDAVYLLDNEFKLTQVWFRQGVGARAEEWRGNDLSGLDFLKDVFSDGLLHWSPQYLSPVLGRPAVAVAQPVPGGLLMAELALARLAGLTRRSDLRDGLMVLAVDGRGELISAPNQRLVDQRTNLNHLALVRAALQGDDAYGEFDFDGQRYNGTTRRSQRLGWGLLVAYPETVASAARDAALLIALVTLLVTLTAGTLIATWLARRMDRVVRGVTTFARQIATGRYNSPAPRSGISELNRLGADLAEVAQAIGQRERLLAEQDRRFRELVENTADLVIELDQQGRLTYRNPSAEAALSHDGEDVLGQHIVDLVADEDRERVERFITAGAELRHNSYRQDLRMRGLGGRVRHVAWSTSVDRRSDGTLLGYRCIGIDVTAQRAAEAAVRRSEERLRAILDSSPTLAVQWFDAQGRVVEWNPASAHLFGWRREEALGRTADELFYTPQQQAEFMAVLADIERSGQPFGPYEGEVRNRAGQAIWLLSTTVRVLGEPVQGQPEPIYVCMDVDISDRKRAESELMALNAELETRIAERTHSLQLANTELEQALSTVQLAQERLVASQDRLVQAEKLASLGSLVAGVAHELNTPIGNGRMAVSTLNERVAAFRRLLAAGLRRSDLDAFVEQVQTGAEIATRNLERASELLSSFKQVAVDQTSDQRRDFYLHEVVDEILLTLQPVFKRSTHEVRSQVPRDLRMDSYPGALGQVLTNLVQNAFVHGLDGREHGRVDITAQPQGEAELLLSVADNGAGIPEAVHRHVFDPFFTTKLGQGGSGLGLPIVRNIVSGALGGSIDFHNLPEGGVVFEVRLPLVAPVPLAPSADVSTAVAAPSTGAEAPAPPAASPPTATSPTALPPADITTF